MTKLYPNNDQFGKEEIPSLLSSEEQLKDGFIIKSHLTKHSMVQEIKLTEDGADDAVEITMWQ